MAYVSRKCYDHRMRYFVLFLLTFFSIIISFNLKAIECPEKFSGGMTSIDDSFYEPKNKDFKLEELEITKEWENLSQEDKDFCTKKIDERVKQTLKEWEEKEKYRFLQSKPGIIFLSGIIVIVYIIFCLLRYFLKRRS